MGSGFGGFLHPGRKLRETKEHAYFLDVVTGRVLGVGQAVKVVDACFTHRPHDELERHLRYKQEINKERILNLIMAWSSSLVSPSFTTLFT